MLAIRWASEKGHEDAIAVTLDVFGIFDFIVTFPLVDNARWLHRFTDYVSLGVTA